LLVSVILKYLVFLVCERIFEKPAGIEPDEPSMTDREKESVKTGIECSRNGNKKGTKRPFRLFVTTKYFL
jgi:hypothetical protein